MFGDLINVLIMQFYSARNSGVKSVKTLQTVAPSDWCRKAVVVNVLGQSLRRGLVQKRTSRERKNGLTLTLTLNLTPNLTLILILTITLTP